MTAVRLFGTEEARKAVEELEQLVDMFFRETSEQRVAAGLAGEAGDYLVELYRPRQHEFIQIYNGVVDAMRVDVAPSTGL